MSDPETEAGLPDPQLESEESREFWRVCATERGRLAVQLLSSRGAMARSELVETMSRFDSAGNYDSVRVDMYQTHLPRMEQAGIVEWNGDDIVQPTERCEAISEAIDAFYDRASWR